MEKKERKLGKILLKVVLGILIAIAVLVIIAVSCIDYIAATGIKKVTPVFTGTNVRLESVNFSIFKTDLRLKGFVIDNPPGYATAEAIKFEEFVVDIDAASIFSDKIIINELRISGPVISLEQGLVGSNLGDIQKNIQKTVNRLSSSSGNDGTVEDKPSATQSKESSAKDSVNKQVIIRHLIIENAIINLGIKGITHAPIMLPVLELNNIGENNSVTIAESIDYVYSKLIIAIVNAASSAGVELGHIAGDLLNRAASDIIASTGNVLNTATGEIGNATKGLGSTAENAAASIGDLGKNIGDGASNLLNSIGKK